jgi:hypothetical protein
MKFVHLVDKNYEIAAGRPFDRGVLTTFECTSLSYDGITTRHWAFTGTNELQAMESTREVFKAENGEYPYLIFIHESIKSTKV